MIRAKRGVFERADDVISFQAWEIIKHSGCTAAPISCRPNVRSGWKPTCPRKGGILVLTRSGQKPRQNRAARQSPDLMLANPAMLSPWLGAADAIWSTETPRVHHVPRGAAAWPLTARAQQPAMPVVGFLRSTPAKPFAHIVAAFRQGLNETNSSRART